MGTLASSYLESSFNKRLSSQYDLSALISEDRFYFMIVNAKQELLVLRDYQNGTGHGKAGFPDFISEVFQKDDTLSLSFQSTKVAVFNRKQTLIPQRLFIEDARATYLEKVVDLLPGDLLLHDNCKSVDAASVYAIDPEEKALLSDKLSDLQWFHASSGFLSGVYKLTEYRTGCHLYVNIRQRFIQLLLFENKDLLFCNVFPFSVSTDVLYYVMLVFDQFKLDQNDLPVYLSGQILKDAEIYKLLYRYIRKIQFVGPPDYIQFGVAFQELPKHQYFDLFSLALCES